MQDTGSAYRFEVTNQFAPYTPLRPFLKSRIALPVVVAAIQLFGTSFAAHHEASRRPLDLAAYVLLGVGPVALTTRRKHPVPVLLFTFAVASAYELLGYVDGPVFLSVAVAVVAATLHGHREAAIGVAVLGYLSFVWGEFVLGLDEAPEPAEAIAVAAWLVALLTIPEVVRVRRERFVEAMRTRAEERKRQASEERLRIAQELHDVLAHNISLINVQAGVALHLLEERPEQARPALAAIKEASNEALGELRSVLDILRQGGDGAPRSPSAGLSQLDALIARTEAAGVTVAKHVRGEPRPLATAVDQAALRIVQESLTNATRHAGGAGVEVTMTYGAHDLIIEVRDQGTGASPQLLGGGRGIPGMRERALALGGHLEAGPLPGGGFRVRARLPYGSDPGEERP